MTLSSESNGKIETTTSNIAGGIFKTRLDDPIISTYLGSFLICNWKIILYLFSSKEVETKISLIGNELYGEFQLGEGPKYLSFWADISLNVYQIIASFLIPASITYFILFVMPKYLRKYYDQILLDVVARKNQKYQAELNLMPIEKTIAKLQHDLNIEIQKNNDLESQKAVQQNTIIRFEKNLSEKDDEISKQKLDQVTLAKNLKNNTELIDKIKDAKNAVSKELESIQKKYNDLLSKSIESSEKKIVDESLMKIEIALERLNIENIILDFRDIAKLLYLKNQNSNAIRADLNRQLVSLGLTTEYYDDEDGNNYIAITDFGKSVFHEINKQAESEKKHPQF